MFLGLLLNGVDTLWREKVAVYLCVLAPEAPGPTPAPLHPHSLRGNVSLHKFAICSSVSSANNSVGANVGVQYSMYSLQMRRQTSGVMLMSTNVIVKRVCAVRVVMSSGNELFVCQGLNRSAH